jgi:glycosyltransferase involved in cell wall biosynthesis
MKMKISVVMAVYNGAKYLNQQMDSLVNQTYPIFELIVQDDNSTDNTVEILESYAKIYPYVKIYKNKEKKGMNGNFFSAMEYATGDYIAIADADDIWELDKLENQAAHIGDYWLCGGFSKPFSDTGKVPFDPRIPNIALERLIHIASALPGHTTLIKKTLLPLILKYRDYPICYDHIIVLVIGSYGKITFVDKILVNYRVHTASQTYTTPVMNPENGKSKSMANIVKSTFRTFLLYFEIKNKMRNWFLMILSILRSLPEQYDSVNLNNKSAQKLAQYQAQKGAAACAKLMLLCVRKQKYLFHVEEKKSLLTLLRALYFPISCSDYFRYMAKNYRK